jgi:urease gamma subunit
MLTPRELEKLNIFVAAELARKRQGRGLIKSSRICSYSF